MRSRAGFTLVELLVVTAIVLLMAAILFPVFARSKAAALRAADLSHTRQIALAATLYRQSHDDRWPIHSRQSGFLTPASYEAPSGYVVHDWAENPEPNFAGLALPYAAETALFRSPASSGWSPQAAPVDDAAPPLNYAYNGFNLGRPLSQAPNPANLCLLWSYTYQTPWSMANPAPDEEGRIQGWFRVAPPHLRQGRVAGQFVIAYLDGHVGTKRRDAWRNLSGDQLKELEIWVY